MSGEYKCNYEGCNMSFYSAEGLQSHKRFHKDKKKEEESTQCPHCDQIFSSKMGCNRHMTMKHGGRTYHPPTILTRRMKVQPVNFLCPKCEIIIPFEDLEDHKIIYHPIDLNYFP